MNTPILVVGELFVDYTLTSASRENKLRLGGIAHAARSLWAVGIPFAVAAVCPQYLRNEARTYLEKFGCVEFIYLGEVIGSPNVMVIGDNIEVGDKGYDDLLREEKTVIFNDVSDSISKYNDVLIFPGKFELRHVHKMLPNDTSFHLDIAYDVQSVNDLVTLVPAIKTILISTSSPLFQELGSNGIQVLSESLKPLSPTTIVLKENRGGARVVDNRDGCIEYLPAALGTTVNSVGVGDVFSAAFVGFLDEGTQAAGLKAAKVSSAYAQTTYPDTFKTYVQRALKLSVEQLLNLGGTSLPWEDRPQYPIYLAAPDFSYVDRSAIEKAIASLKYHNFVVRRPVQENGELPPDADVDALVQTYRKDVDLLTQCAMVFAVPTDRDPGTLVEIGLAIKMGLPVVVYDPNNECRNTMVIAGATCYSQSMDECLNSVFTVLSDILSKRNG